MLHYLRISQMLCIPKAIFFLNCDNIKTERMHQERFVIRKQGAGQASANLCEKPFYNMPPKDCGEGESEGKKIFHAEERRRIRRRTQKKKPSASLSKKILRVPLRKTSASLRVKPLRETSENIYVSQKLIPYD